MNVWHDPKVKLPEDNQECLLMPVDRGGMCTLPVFGPIMWSVKNQVWLDIFATPEAGTIATVEQVGKWCDWASIAPKDEHAKN